LGKVKWNKQTRDRQHQKKRKRSKEENITNISKSDDWCDASKDRLQRSKTGKASICKQHWYLLLIPLAGI
jgi:hypothetical protein